MYFGLSEDQEFFQENIKKFLDDNAPVDVIRKIATDYPEHQKDIQEGLVSLGINSLLVLLEKILDLLRVRNTF